MSLRRSATRWPENLARLGAEYENRARELDEAADTLQEMLAGVKR